MSNSRISATALLPIEFGGTFRNDTSRNDGKVFASYAFTPELREEEDFVNRIDREELETRDHDLADENEFAAAERSIDRAWAKKHHLVPSRVERRSGVGPYFPKLSGTFTESVVRLISKKPCAVLDIYEKAMLFDGDRPGHIRAALVRGIRELVAQGKLTRKKLQATKRGRTVCLDVIRSRATKGCPVATAILEALPQ
jgi:hypothetical protein